MGNNTFRPNLFVNITDTIDRKIEAMKHYEIELRDFPHPRSIEGIKNLASYRGQSIGVPYAEAFEIKYLRDFPLF